MSSIKKRWKPISEANEFGNKMRAKFISLEGSEGAGKTTAMQVIVDQLSQWDVSFIQTREPGGQPNAEMIRELLLHSDHLDAQTELLLMFAARNEHVNKVIRPALERKQWVVSDRFVDASYAYQGFGRGIDWQVIEYLEDLVVGDTKPDLTIMLDVDPVIGLERAAQRSAKDRIEKEDTAFFENIRKGYLLRAEKDPERIKLINANQTMETVKGDLISVLKSFKESIEA